MNHIENKIRAWSDERGLIECTTPQKQLDKLREEVDELASCLVAWLVFKEDLPIQTQLELGDCGVVLINLAYKFGWTLEECIEAAYQKIKDRKGQMIDGTFVKEG